MTDTDRAFIAAYRQPSSVVPTAPGNGPHFKATPAPARRARLSDLIEQSHIVDPGESGAPRIELDAFRWPKVVEELCEYDALAFRKLLDTQAKVVALASTEAGIGLTTLVLALARTAALKGKRIAVFDATPKGSGLASSLGVRRLPTLRETFIRGLPYSSCTLWAEQDMVSLASVGMGWEPFAVTDVLNSFHESADLILIDLGAVRKDNEQMIWAAPAATTLLVEKAAEMTNSQLNCRRVALDQLKAVGARVEGLIQSLAAA